MNIMLKVRALYKLLYSLQVEVSLITPSKG